MITLALDTPSDSNCDTRRHVLKANVEGEGRKRQRTFPRPLGWALPFDCLLKFLLILPQLCFKRWGK